MTSCRISFRKFPSTYKISFLLGGIKRVLTAEGSSFLRRNTRNQRTDHVDHVQWPGQSVRSRLTVYVSRVMCLRVIFPTNFDTMSIMLAHREFVSQFQISLSNVPLMFNQMQRFQIKTFKSPYDCVINYYKSLRVCILKSEHNLYTYKQIYRLKHINYISSCDIYCSCI